MAQKISETLFKSDLWKVSVLGTLDIGAQDLNQLCNMNKGPAYAEHFKYLN